jgi:hypothetical protein
MLSNAIEESAAEFESVFTWAPKVLPQTRPDWRTVDRTLRAIRRSRAALDAEEMHWLREAEALQIWRPLGMVSALDYLERGLGYAPRTAQDRLRVARALGTLPGLTAALARDELAFSAVRELTRVVTPATETSWIVAATGKNLRQIEELVAEHHPGDRPDDPPDPKARPRVVRFELAAENFALLRQARMMLDDEHGTHLSDDAFVAALCSGVLDGAPAGEPTGRAKFQIAVTVCQRCRRGWQQGAGAQIAIDPESVDRAMCDAQHIGSIDGSGPERAYQDIPPSVARFVWRRDGGRCRVDGCRSARGLELHHIVHRADGGSHDAKNIILACFACHRAHHRGALTITGTAEHLEIRRSGPMIPSADANEGTVRVTTSGTGVGAHMGATEAAAPVADADAEAPIEPASRREAGAQVVGVADAVAVPTDVDAQAEAATQPALRMEVGAHMGAVHGATSSATGAGAHMGAGGAASRFEIGAHTATANVTISTKAGSEPAGSATRLDAASLCAQAKAALTGLGWKPAIAHAAVAAAAASQGVDMTLERLVFESLRRCPAPKA